jgi:putative tryptophan/tyrosine transport system substrate-binding protein
MRRREFISSFGIAAFALPLAARAQQQAMPVIGYLRSTSREPFASLEVALRQGLNEAGFLEGRSVAIISRYGDNQPDRLPVLTAELIRHPVAVIVGNNPSVRAAKAATSTIPIVFTVGGDPVREGLVPNMNRPGGNITGISFLAGVVPTKRLELVRQFVPSAKSIALMVHPNTPETEAERAALVAAAQAVDQQIIVLEVKSDRELEEGFANAVQRGAGAMFIGTGAFMTSKRLELVALAARYRLPTIYNGRESAEAGGLMSYGTSQTEAYRQAGIYAGRILKGEKPGDLPVLQSTRFELAINLKTAKALGLTVPTNLLVAADEVIE